MKRISRVFGAFGKEQKKRKNVYFLEKNYEKPWKKLEETLDGYMLGHEKWHAQLHPAVLEQTKPILF